jgi:hypothetical protein
MTSPVAQKPEIVIGARFNGPPGSANGGYACGLVARLLGGGTVEVRLRRPPPLDRPLRWDAATGALRDGDDVVAEGAPVPAADAGPPADLPAPVDLAVARAAAAGYPGLVRHPYPTCFGCGPERAPGDGLRISPGPVPGRRVVAAAWTPHASVVVDGEVPLAVAWAALDCTGGWAGLGDVEGRFVLGTMRGGVTAHPAAGAPHVVTGWQQGLEGRKLGCASSLRTAAGDLLGWSQQTWIRIGDE